ncbi:DUF309 domain-containing protein [Tropicibacter naphthalenivorans]|uniref:DUF309 domain-containing protein n=1 Tax=Tropicibacter naphthalenivorans TaxID=441103 RepID=A0A0P1GJT0_9RHOB|nr:DUF309 domain-containing protein [Tropicibacter naphthalenivorans]CUH82072.1 hypothetical protein TRN7648_03800 [Tropicibacter naphthalenivorans]SMD08410.1 hypothetical protein SAMN04488093_11725 [Tropicibacter naphthalenivorans]
MTDWRPPFAYLPGQTARHPEGAFDRFKQVAPGALSASMPWRLGLDLYHEGFFWEAHELWEAVWLAAPPNSAERCAIQGVIQLANAALKRRMGREAAAQRLDDLAEAHLLEAARRGADVMALTETQILALKKIARGPQKYAIKCTLR